MISGHSTSAALMITAPSPQSAHAPTGSKSHQGLPNPDKLQMPPRKVTNGEVKRINYLIDVHSKCFRLIDGPNFWQRSNVGILILMKGLRSVDWIKVNYCSTTESVDLLHSQPLIISNILE